MRRAEHAGRPLPDVLDITDTSPPDGQILDGMSVLPLLKQDGDFEREAVCFHYPHYHHSRPAGAIRSGNWKLIEMFDDGTLELYDLKNDLGETTNLAE